MMLFATTFLPMSLAWDAFGSKNGAATRAAFEAMIRNLVNDATQVDPTSAWWFGLDDDELAQVYPWEDWILARSLVGVPAPGELESDLFAGVRSGVLSGSDAAPR